MAIRKKLNISKTSYYRMLKNIRSENIITTHGLSNRESNRKPYDLNEIIQEYKNFVRKINDFREDNNFRITNTDFYYMLDNPKFSLKTLHRKLIDANIFSPCANKKTKREINKKIRELQKPKLKKELKEINQYELFKECKPYKGKNYCFGEIVEIDACQHQ